MGSMSSLRLVVAFGLLLVIVTTAPERTLVMPRQWLIEKLTVSEAEARHTRLPDDRAERRPELKKPFGALNKDWENLKKRMQPGDELWTWEKTLWPGAGGIALVRNREVIEAIMTWIQ